MADLSLTTLTFSSDFPYHVYYTGDSGVVQIKQSGEGWIRVSGDNGGNEGYMFIGEPVTDGCSAIFYLDMTGLSSVMIESSKPVVSASIGAEGTATYVAEPAGTTD